MNRRLAAALALSAFCLSGAKAASEPERAPARQTARMCPSVKPVWPLCTAVYDNTPARRPDDRTQYTFQEMMREAACVDAGDSAELEASKIRSMWDSHPEWFRCNAVNFDLPGGDILKYSVRTRTFEFINEALDSWKLDFNHVADESGWTLLDYIENEMGENVGTDIYSQLLMYRDLIVDAGAKRCAAIHPSAHCRPTGPR